MGMRKKLYYQVHHNGEMIAAFKDETVACNFVNSLNVNTIPGDFAYVRDRNGEVVHSFEHEDGVIKVIEQCLVGELSDPRHFVISTLEGERSAGDRTYTWRYPLAQRDMF